MSQPLRARHERINDLFASAVSLAPAARAALLDPACAGDQELRRAVEQMLADYQSAQQFFGRFESFARVALGQMPSARMFSDGELVAGRFQVVGFLGAGGMGEVYEAEDLLLDREHVALKTLPAEIADDASAIARLKREMALARQVTHLNVCRVFDVDQHLSPSGAAIAFFTMELLKGETLAARLQRAGPLSKEDARPLIQQMAAALGTAHSAGIVHGDFKPGNVVLVPSGDGCERLVVTDFGLARRASPEKGPQTVTSQQAWGTPVYMAPEQFAGRRPSRATDLYALAAVVFEMVTGTRVVDVEVAASTGLDPRWRSAIVRCLDANPEARFQTAGELLSALSAANPEVVLRWRRIGALAGLSLPLLLLMPPVRSTLRAMVDRASAVSVTPQQTVAVLPLTGADRTPDDEASSRGLAATIADQLGAVPQYKPALLFVRTAEMSVTAASSPIRVQRTLGADVIVAVRIGRTSGQRDITVQVHRASAGEPTPVPSSRVELRDGDQILPRLRTEVVRMLALRQVPAAIEAIEATGTRLGAAEDQYILGRGYLELGRVPRLDVARLDLAADAFRHAVALDPRFAAAHAALGETLVLKYEGTKDNGKDTHLLDLAERSADEALRLAPTLAQVHVVRALTHLATGQHARAIPSLEEALRLDPDAVGARENLVRSYVAIEQLPRAERVLEDAVARHPTYWAAHEDLGVFRLNRGEYTQAESHFLSGRQYAPDNPRVISNLAGLYTLTELFDAAEHELSRGLEFAPDPILYNNLAQLHFYQGNFAKGVESMQRAVSLSRDDSIVLAGLARGYRWMARSSEARAAREIAIAAARNQLNADPRDAVVRANLAYLYAEAGDHAEAGRQIHLALVDAPLNVRVRFTSALVLELTGRRHEALEALSSAIDRGNPKYQVAHHPDLRDLRSDDRYAQLLERVGWKR